MISLKIQCPCGQKYSFDVEPANGRMPWKVNCPVCGVDGTEAADSQILERASVRVVARAVGAPAIPAMAASSVSVASGGELRISAVAHSPASPQNKTAFLNPGQLDPMQALHEAKAKILWGDEPESVSRFLMMHGFSAQDATGHVDEMFQERASTIRKNGIRKIIIGTVLVCVPIFTIIGLWMVRFLDAKIIGLTLMVGTWGAWMLLKGCIMFLAPKSEPGDVSDH